MGEAERNGESVVLEVFPACIGVPACTTLHEAVLGAVVLVLQTYQEVVDVSREGNLVGEYHGSYIAEVAIGERVGTDGGHNALDTVGLLEDVDGRELVAVEASGDILVRISGTEEVVDLTVEEAAVQLTCERVEVVFGKVVCALERQAVSGLAAAGLLHVTNVCFTVADGVYRVRCKADGLAGYLAVTEGEGVVAVDVPVDATEYFGDRGSHGEVLVAAGIVVVFACEIIFDLVHLRCGGTVNGTAACGIPAAVVSQPVGSGAGLGLVLKVQEEEEFVLDDGTAHGSADGVADSVGSGKLFDFAGSVCIFATLDLTGSVIVVYGYLELVGTAFGYRVDCCTGETTLTYVVRGDVDAHLLDSVQRDRGTTCGEVGTDTECIVERSTVDSDVRRTIVTAAGCETADTSGSLGSEAEDIVDATAGRGGEVLHGPLADRCACTGTLDVHAGLVGVSC